MATILVVDDRPINRDLLVTLLSHFGHRLLEAEDGNEALALAHTEHPGLIISDIHMPFMGGDEFALRLRNDPALARIPVIFYTATYRVPEARSIGDSCGAFAVLAKPTSPEVILDTVNAALGVSEPARTLPRVQGSGFAETIAQVGLNSAETGLSDRLGYRLATLVETILDIALERNPERLLEKFCSMSRHLTGAGEAIVGIVEEDGRAPRCFVSSLDHAGAASCPSPPKCVGLIRELLEQSKPLRLRNVSADRWDGAPLASFLGVPIHGAEHIYGWLCLTDKLGAEEFTQEDERLAVTLTAQLGIAYENIQLFEKVRCSAANLEREVAERKKAQEDLERNREQQLRLKDELLSHVSHELRSPVTAIHQFVTILLDGLAGQLTPEQREYLEIALRNTHQLRGMIDDLLQATRAEAGKLVLEPECVSVATLIAEIVVTFRAAAAEREIALSADIPRGLPDAHADPRSVRQILVNLVDNALKFTPDKGAITLRAFVSEKNENLIRLTVADTGRGIPREDTQRIFERLYQVPDPSRAGRKGLGLGLHICKELATRQGGEIWVESRPGEGSEFHFTLPVFSMARLVGPILVQDGRLADTVALLTIEAFPGRQWPSPKAREAAMQEARKLLERCILPDLDLLLPAMGHLGPAADFTVLARADRNGAKVLSRRIRDQLERSEALREARPNVSISSAILELHVPSDGSPLDQQVNAAAARVEAFVETTLSRRS